MCRLALLSVLGACIGQPALAASSHHYGQRHAAFRYARFPRIIEMPTHSWGHVTESATPLEERPLNEVPEEDKLHAEKEQALRHPMGFQHALQNAEQKVREEEIHEQKENVLAKHHQRLQHHLSKDKNAHAKEKKVHHLGFQRALANAEKRVLEEERVLEAERHEAKEAEERKLQETKQKALQADRLRENEETWDEKAIRERELQEADAEAERVQNENARRLIAKRGTQGRWDPAAAMKKGFEDAARAGKKATKGIADALDEVYDTAGKPLMNPINTMRAELCIRRKPLLTHKPCMKFMIKECKSKSSGKGYCKKFFHMVLDACFRAQEQGSDPNGYCELSEELGSKRDVDEDGVPDITDRFPANREEWSDMDNDGIGDNEDPDRDGDGFLNENDEYPDDPERPEVEKNDMDGDGIPDDEDPDKDGDGHDNEADAYPEDPSRWAFDSPAAAPVAAPAPAPPAAPAADPEGMTKEIVGLPEQGYGEYYRDKLVKYEDGDDYTTDWNKEWPLMDETHAESVLKACDNNPKSTWCKRFRLRLGREGEKPYR